MAERKARIWTGVRCREERRERKEEEEEEEEGGREALCKGRGEAGEEAGGERNRLKRGFSRHRVLLLLLLLPPLLPIFLIPALVCVATDTPLFSPSRPSSTRACLTS